MGCDGGTIPRRDELVRLKKKPEKKDKDAEMAAKWKLCCLTQQVLQHPIVACELGRLYNKDSVIELLLDRSKFEGAINSDHIKGLKDVRELQLTENPDYMGTSDKKGDTSVDRRPAEFICPVTGIEMSGKYKFVFLHKCGCAFSERAMKEVKGEICHKCGKSFKSDDVITINPTEVALEDLKARMEQRHLQAKLDKKAKKKKAEAAASGPSTSTVTDGASSTKQAKMDPDAAGPSTSKVKDGKARLANGTTGKTAGLSNDKKDTESSKSSSGIQKDPAASKAYKSLFTSSDECKNQPKAHWVTYNPCFY